MIYKICASKVFKSENLQNWRLNSDFWLKGKMRHLNDVYQVMGAILRPMLADKSQHRRTLLDVGCGEGWLLRLIREKGFDVNYIGVDFNEDFIAALSNQYSGDSRVRFMQWDIEEPVPQPLLDSADIAVNSFNLFEIPNLDVAFCNIAASLKARGTLLVLTIDPIIQLISISDSIEDLREGLREYEQADGQIAYDKVIETNDGNVSHIYKGILYSISQYVQTAKHAGMTLSDCQELVKTAGSNPQIYQFLWFHK